MEDIRKKRSLRQAGRPKCNLQTVWEFRCIVGTQACPDLLNQNLHFSKMICVNRTA